MNHSVLTHQFEGHALTTLTVQGRPAWVAREIGALLGYANDGKRFVNRITGEWSGEFLPGHDFAMLVGEELANAKSQLGDGRERLNGLLVLFESGIHLALTKTTMKIGRRLRRFLVDEVLPQIARTGKYAPDEPKAAPSIVATRMGLLHARELRLAARVDLDDRKFRTGALQHTADLLYGLGRITVDAYVTCQVTACEIALGQPLTVLTPRPPEAWFGIAHIADGLDVDDGAVFAAARSLGLLDGKSPRVRALGVLEDGAWTVDLRFDATAGSQGFQAIDTRT